MLKLDVLAAELNLWANETEQIYRATKESKYRGDAKHLRYLAATLNQSSLPSTGVTSFNTRVGDVVLSSLDVTTALGYNPVTQARTLTINGVTYDLSANRSWTISTAIPTLAQVTTAGNTTTNAITVGGLTISNGSASITKTTSGATLTLTPNASDNAIVINNNGFIKFTSSSDSFIRGSSTTFGILDASYASKVQFHWGGSASFINTGGNLLIGTTTDAGYKLDVNGTARVQATVGINTYIAQIINPTNSGAQFGLNVVGGNNDNARILHVANGTQTILNVKGNRSVNLNAPLANGNYATLFVGNAFGGYPTLLVKGNGTASEITFQTQNSSGTALLTTLDNGNVLIGTTTDAGYKLDVNGSVRVQGTGTTSATTAFTIQNSASTNLLQVRNDNSYLFGSNTSNRPVFQTQTSNPVVSGNLFTFNGGGGSTDFQNVSLFRILQPNFITNANAYYNALDIDVTTEGYSRTNAPIRMIYIHPTFNSPSILNETIGIDIAYPRVNVLDSLIKVSNSVSNVLVLRGDGRLTTSGSITASSSLAQGVYFNNTLVAAANNDVLVGLDIAPTFTNGAFTGVSNIGLRVSGQVLFNAYGAYNTVTPTLRIENVDTNNVAIQIKGNVANYKYYWIYDSQTTEGIYKSDQARIDFYGGTNVGFAFRNNYGRLFTIVGTTGNVLINTTTDAGYKLDVNGTARVSSTIRVGSTFNGTLATLADFRGASDANFVQIARETDTNRGVKIYASGMIIASSIETSGAAYSFLNNVSGSASNGNRLFFNISGGWAPTSGTASWDQVRLNPTINTTGTYAGIVRGIYYNPTLTSLTGTTHRAIETVTGDVIFGSTSGNVGIGTTTPTARLQIKGIGDSSVWVTTDDFNSGTNTGTVVRIGTRNSTGNTQGWIDALNSGVSSYGNLIIAGFGGNVLIGTTTDAGYKLDVNGIARVGDSGGSGQLYIKGFAGTGQYLYLDDGSKVWSLVGATNYSIQENGTSRLTIKEGGNVGIGILNPTEKLHIADSNAGNIFARISAFNSSASGAWVAQNDQIDNIVYRIFGSTVGGTQFGQSLNRSASLMANLGGSGKFLIGSYSGTDLIFGTSDQARMRLVDSTGNFLIGTMTDSGHKLSVSGTAKIGSDLTLDAGLIIDSTDITNAWTAYTPTWSSNGGTQPTLGDGTITGFYKKIGKTVFVRLKLNFGVSTTGGTGAWLFSLPVNASSSEGIQFPCSMLDNGFAWYQGIVNGTYSGFTDKTAIIAQSPGGANSSQGVSGSFPFGWGNTDSLQFNGSYECI